MVLVAASIPGALAVRGADTLAVFQTPLGEMDVQLYALDKPVTVSNFVRYVEAGRYRDSIFHRAPVMANGRAGFVVQGGGVWVTNRGKPTANFALVDTFPPIPNEYAVGRRFTNGYGTLAMAKVAGNTNSASSQWYFNLRTNLDLDAPDTNNLFVVFGRVIRGTNVLEQVKTFRGYTGVETTNVIANLGNLGPPLDTMLQSLPLRAPTVAETNLLWTDISVLRASVSVGSDGARTIGWRSVRDVPNRVEYSPPPGTTWVTVATRLGTGDAMTVVDAQVERRSGVYRVAVDFP
jgi:cyclophilin family peptidyl-prolyl cis-trans isomerase